ncbi:hypothetical protein SMD20_17920 [Nonomuraea sp. LP-02]|uniref:hypothetical protein n=1 Tax=Nonomuraea sp. LP-02 TaxID=3097960 RepID=UPI002E356709|nr:hypothetical protein [Nonomuraea sp. LP-02]MED7926138.1 hypothetical protein [Nonomuraea sp. LP-02]
MRLLRTAVVLTLAALLAACASSTTDKDAAAIVTALAEQGLPVKLSVAYDESTDPNHLLGRPNGYTSKAAFTDSRIDASQVAGDKGDVGLGGGVEVFDDAGTAEKRAEYIKAVATAPMLAEYTYIAGNVVVRVSKHITPTDAKAFEDALAKIVQ